MSEQLVWLDLCSGLGGASQPALDRGWRVIRVDIDPRFKPDIVADVRALPLKPFHIDVLWASPPCQDFSKWGLRCFYPKPPEPNLSIALGVKAEIERLTPACWVVENVWASRPWLSRIFGQVRAKPPGHALWSNQLLMLPNIVGHKTAIGHSFIANWPKERGGHDKPFKIKIGANGQKIIQKPAIQFGPKRYAPFSATAAKIPYEIGAAICAAVERRRDEAESATA